LSLSLGLSLSLDLSIRCQSGQLGLSVQRQALVVLLRMLLSDIPALSRDLTEHLRAETHGEAVPNQAEVRGTAIVHLVVVPSIIDVVSVVVQGPELARRESIHLRQSLKVLFGPTAPSETQKRSAFPNAAEREYT